MAIFKEFLEGLKSLPEKVERHLEGTAEALGRRMEDYPDEEAGGREKMDTIEMRFTRDELPEENRAIVMFTRIMPLGRDMEIRGFYNGGAFITEFGEEIKTEVHGWYYLDSVSTEEQ